MLFWHCFNFKFISPVPPKELLIMDVEGQKLEGVIGPYDEASNVILICEAEGGMLISFFVCFF